jgi:hypothetical protein
MVKQLVRLIRMKINYSSPYSEDVVIGKNAEYADMNNPSGLIYGRKIFVEAVTESGRRFVFGRDFESQEGAGKFAARVEAKGSIDLQFWSETYPVYGSSAWAAEDSERDMNLRHAIAFGDTEGMERYS